MKTKSLLAATITTVVTATALCTAAYADTNFPAPGKWTIGPNIEVTTLIDSYYQYNFNRPPVSSDPELTPQNNFRSYDRVHHQLAVNQARVGLSHDADPAGFDLQVGFGSQLDVLGTVDNEVDRTYSYVRRATFTYGREFYVQIGRFDANFGLEAIDSVDNWNYSRSLQFTTSQPKLYLGAILGYNYGKNWKFRVAGTNGADRFSDNNRGKTFLAQTDYVDGDYSAGLSYSAGSERVASSLQWRHTVNLHGQVMLSETYGLGLDASFVTGMSELLQSTPERRESARRYGAAAYGMAKFWKTHQDAVRFEWLHDEKGAALLQNKANTIFATTLTHRWMATQNVSFWGEVRWDHATKDNTFYNESGDLSREDQVTALVAGTFHI